MPLSIKNYAKELPKDLLALAEKNTVRECDENGKGHFVAYVDEGDNSYDVALEILPNNEIGENSCDCKSAAAFCRHKAALLLHVANGKKIKSPLKAKKKKSPAETMLEQADPIKLLEWIKELIQKNKDIELAFLNHFSPRRQFTAEDVVKLVKDAIKAVVGNKKNIDATQLKKLVELWNNVLAPVLEHYLADVTDKDGFRNLHTILEQCTQFQSGININSNKVPKFIEQVLQQSETAISNLQTDDAWHKAVDYFITNVSDGIDKTRMHYLLHINNIIRESNDERKEKVADKLVIQFKEDTGNKALHSSNYVKIFFTIIADNDLFPKYYSIFKPLYFENDYNEKLIRLLIDNGHLAQAKKYCQEQIGGNYREEYNIPYLQLLKEIFTTQKDNAGLAKVLADLFPYTFDFDDYRIIAASMPVDEQKKWRTRMLTKARNAARGNPNAMSFSFRLMDAEKNYKKMIDYIDSDTPYAMMLQYFEPMVLADKNNLIRKIMNRSDNSGWMRSNHATDDSCFPELADIAIKHYTADFLKAAISQVEAQKYYYRSNHFLTYLKKHFGELQ